MHQYQERDGEEDRKQAESASQFIIQVHVRVKSGGLIGQDNVEKTYSKKCKFKVIFIIKDKTV